MRLKELKKAGNFILKSEHILYLPGLGNTDYVVSIFVVGESKKTVLYTFQYKTGRHLYVHETEDWTQQSLPGLLTSLVSPLVQPASQS
jgi:hypothetical protein